MNEHNKNNEDEAKRKTQKLGMAGSKIANYTLVRELGHGGQGYVYLARDENLGRDVALKILHNMSALNPKTRLRFVREAETASKLTHPGLCAVHEFGEYEGMPFIAMQYVEGVPLSDKISTAKDSAKTEGASFVAFDTTTSAGSKKEETPSATGKGSNSKTRINGESPQDRDSIMKVVKMIEDAARALHAAHEESLIHRDIKPANIILAHDGRPVILDFGLARDEESDQATLTMTGDLMGTPAYMSPEQITRSSIRVDRRSDVYSLGVTLFECLTLERPFAAPNREKLYQAIMFQDPPNARKLNPVISDDLRVIVEMALEKDPDRRYQTAEEFAEDLRRVREYKPIHAKPAGPWIKTVRWVQRNPAVATASVVVFLALVAVAGVFYVKEKDASASRDEALLAQEDAEAARDEAQTARDLAKSESEQKSIALKREQAALVAEKNERNAKESALADKSKALSDFERLADVKKYQEASATAEKLWPARPDKIDAIEKWLQKYEELSQSLAGHQESLAALRETARPYSEEEQIRDYPSESKQLAELKKRLKSVEEKYDSAENESLEKKLGASIDKIEADIDTLAIKMEKRLSWRFGDDDVKQWKHDVLTELVESLGLFCAEKTGTYADVQRRLLHAQTIAKETIADHQALWDKTIAAIKGSDKYDGLDLKAQVGLVPLGKDPTSDLFEFLHLETHEGPIPERNREGKIPMTEKTGIILVLIPKGKFSMGSQKTDPKGQNFDPQSRSDEELREVEILESFFLSKYEMTQGQWQRAPSVNKSPSYYGVGWKYTGHKGEVGLFNPVEQVSWTMSNAVLSRVGLDLPSEEQWEYAARAGTSSIYVGGVNEVKDITAWGNIAGLETKGLFSTSEKLIRDDYLIHGAVGQFKANAFGLFDVLG
ncbi:MAG: serine/threonine protein kinase, partial [Planctomycetota bacterium]